MRKLLKVLLTVILIVLSPYMLFGQNTFPSSGNVGIGTTSPTTPLDIVSSLPDAGIRIRASGINTGIRLHVAGGDYGYLSLGGNTRLRGNEMHSSFEGKVGIGTTNPEEKLDVNGNIALGINKNIYFRRSDGHWSGRIENKDREFRFTNTSGSGFITFFQNANGGGTQEIMRIHTNGYVGIGTTNPTEKLTVNGTVRAEEVIVVENVGADFVFKEEYKLPDLNQVEAYIKQHNHLPEIPSVEEMRQNGVKMGALQMKLLQKIEELTLYVIELKKENKQLKKYIDVKLSKQQ